MIVNVRHTNPSEKEKPKTKLAELMNVENIVSYDFREPRGLSNVDEYIVDEENLKSKNDNKWRPENYEYGWDTTFICNKRKSW